MYFAFAKQIWKIIKNQLSIQNSLFKALHIAQHNRYALKKVTPVDFFSLLHKCKWFMTK